MYQVKVNSIVYVRLAGGAPSTRCTLKGKLWHKAFNRWLYVVLPLESRWGYVRGVRSTCYSIVPGACRRWRNKGLTFAPKPFNVNWDELPIIEDL